MFNWLKKLFSKKPAEKQIQVLDDFGRPEQDEMLVEAMRRTMATGKVVIANRNKDGSFTINECE